jgi:hypothetical protein
MIQDGPRGFEGEEAALQEDEAIEDVDQMGIDWTIESDPVLLAHYFQNNSAETQETSFGAPPKFSHVPCEPPVGPFTGEEVAVLWAELAQRVDITTRSMLVRRQMWIHALDICEDIERRREA